MVVYNVHDNADALVVKSLYHLLEFLYSHFAVIRVCGVGAFGSVIVLRVIAPVELICAELGLVNAAIVVNGQKMNMGNAKICKVIYACGMYAVIVYGRARFGEGKVFALVLHAGIR